MPDKEHVFTIKLSAPEGVPAEMVERYVADALRCWRGGYLPDDPRFDIELLSVSETVYRKTHTLRAKHS